MVSEDNTFSMKRFILVLLDITYQRHHQPHLHVTRGYKPGRKAGICVNYKSQNIRFLAFNGEI